MTEQTPAKKRWPGLFRRLSAVALALAFFLPVSSCSSPFAGGHEVERLADIEFAAQGATEGQRIYRYPYKMLAIDKPSSLPIVVAFFWPLFVLGVRKFRPRSVGIKFTILEALLCLVTFWAVWGMGYLERLEVGGYLAFGGAAIYLAAVSADLIRVTKQKRGDVSSPSRHNEMIG